MWRSPKTPEGLDGLAWLALDSHPARRASCALQGLQRREGTASSPMLMAVISFIASQREKKKGKQKGSAGWIDRRRG